MTISTNYNDFITGMSRLSEDAVGGALLISVENASIFSAGNTVELFDSNGSVQRTTVISITKNVLTISDPTDRTYAKVWGASIRVRKNSFSNTHQHSIRNAEIGFINDEDFANAGYPVEHNHVLKDRIADVSCVMVDVSGKIIVAGSSNKVMSSLDRGESWNEEIDINEVGSSNECEAVTCIVTNSEDRLSIGTACGFIISQSDSADRSAIPLEVLTIEESSSSSSSSESSSVSSQSSSLTSMSSVSSFSSSESSISSGSSISSQTTI
jgi:hypothetical protein